MDATRICDITNEANTHCEALSRGEIFVDSGDLQRIDCYCVKP